MKKAGRKLIALVLCMILLNGVAPVNGLVGIDLPIFSNLFATIASAADPTSGSCGENLIWEYNGATNTLTISGHGAMEQYAGSAEASTAPWKPYVSSIKTIIVKDGVTQIGSYAFRGCSNATSIIIPETVDYIGMEAFRNTGITSFVIPDSVTSLGQRAFMSCNSLEELTIGGGVREIDLLITTVNKLFVSPENKFYYSKNNCVINKKNKELVLGCKGSIIPSDGSITSIGDYAFDGVSSLGSINIPDSVVNIGEFAFANCEGLTSVYISESVQSIGRCAFSSCTDLTIIEVAENNRVFHSSGNCIIETATKTLIAGCGSSTIPSDGSVTSIGEDAFYGFSNLKNLAVPNSVISIGYSAFANSGLTSLNIPESVTTLPSDFCRKCTELENITIPDSVTSIGSSAFEDCDSLTSINIPDSVTSIGSLAFYSCDILLNITIPDSVSSIGSYAFKNTKYYLYIPNWINNEILYIGNHLIEVDDSFSGELIVKDGTRTIADQAFSSLCDVTGITIPSSVVYIGTHLTNSLDSLVRLTVSSDNTVYHSEGNCIIETASKTMIGGCKSSIIPDDGSVETIGDGAFQNIESITVINIPGSVTSIGSNAFWGCTGLTSFVIPDSVTSIGDSVFYSCTGLTKITLSSNIISIGRQAFYKCTGLEEIEIPDSVSHIGEQAFYRCSGLSKVTIGQNVEIIDKDAFSNCTGLTEIVYNSSKEITVGEKSNLFYKAGRSADGITVSFGESVEIIPDYLFFTTQEVSIGSLGSQPHTPNIKQVSFGANISSVGEYAFYNCCNITELIFNSNSLKDIGSHAFFNCDGLESLSLPDSVVNIGDYAFYGCDGLTELELPERDISIGLFAFGNCKNLQSVNLPEAPSNIDISVFSGCIKLLIQNDVALEMGLYYFGRYPQNKVTDSSVLSYLNNSNETEIDYEGASYQLYDNVWFEVSPIRWRVLKYNNNQVLLLSEHVLDAEPYNTENSEVSWDECSLNEWLNTEFKAKAFSVDEVKELSPLSENFEVSLLTAQDAVNPEYGFAADQYSDDYMRQAIGTDFAELNGAFLGMKTNKTSYYVRESVPATQIHFVLSDDYNGCIGDCHNTAVVTDKKGIRPLICLNVGQSAHTISYYVDGAAYTTQEFECGAEITNPTDPEKEGCYFTGWKYYTDSDCTEEVTVTTMPDFDLYAVAQWGANIYTITLEGNGGSFLGNGTGNLIFGVPFGGNPFENWEAEETPSREGYTFTGWDKEIPATMPAEDLVIKALWTANEYKVTYKLDGVEYFATPYTSAVDTVVYGETVTVREKAVKEGYTVSDWEFTPALENGKMPAGDVTANAVSSINSYTITYNVDGEFYDSKTYQYNADITKLATPEKQGYVFSGWDTEEPAKMPAENLVLSGSFTAATDTKYAVETYTMNLSGAYDKTSENRAGTTGETATAEHSAPEGFTLNSEKSVLEGVIKPDGSLVLKVYFDRNRHNITFNDGTNETTEELYYGEEITKPEDPVKEGNDFLGWSEDGETVVDIPETVPDREITYIAVWSVKQYTIIFKYGEVNNNATYKTVSGDFGTTVEAIADPVFDGYTFAGWDSQIPATMPANNITVTALWAINEYKVTYKLDGAEYFATPYTSAVDTVVYGETVTVREKAVKEGYTVSDWEFTPALVDGKMPAGDVVANAVSTVNTYTVTWIVNGNATIDTYNFGAQINKPANPTVSGKVFKGWSGEIPATMPARNLEFTASFESVTHNATFVVPDKNGTYTDETGTYEVIKTVIFNEGQTTLAEPAVPERDGYVGLWESYTLGAADIVIKAIYSITDVDNTGEIEAEKTADVNGDGTVTITLNAFSDAKSILVDGENEPLDIVLVVDQSGSMAYKMGKDENAAAGQRRRDYLVSTATSFVNSVKQNAESTGADHRISIVGFAMSSQAVSGYSAYENTEVLTTKNDSPVAYNKATDSVYKNSLMSVGSNYNHIMAAINNIDAKGATAADLGFDMAAKVLAQNASDRKKVVVFLTDGEPTATNAFDSGVANKAIINAKYLKAQDIAVYSIAISDKASPADTSSDFNKFLHATSSNYNNASSIWHLDEGSNNGYFLSVNDANALKKIFDNIYVRSVAKTLNFGAVTLYDTVKREFTMTVPQEKAFREDMIAKYGVTNSDITVDRRDDGTTYIEVRNITPYAYYDSTNVMQGWKAEASFDVTANENALNSGSYLTNTDEAGVIIGGSTVAKFTSPTAAFSGNRNIVEFIIGNDIYEIKEVSIGDNVVAPECSDATWSIPEGTKVSSKVSKYYADYGEKDRTATWNIGDEKITQNYAPGERITFPEVNAGDKVFIGWNPGTEAFMGFANLEYTAVFSEHVHNYRKTASYGLCTEGRTEKYTCSCGASYTEKVSACEHNLETTVYESDSATITHIFCTECPYSEDKVLTFKTANTGSYGWGYNNSTVASFDLYNDVNGGEIHNLDDNQYLYIRVPVTSLNSTCQQSLRQGKTINIIHYLENGGTEKCTYAVDGDYIVVKCTSFSYYVFTSDEVDNSINNASLDCLFDGHQFKYVYNNDATTAKDGTETEVCDHCGAKGNTRTAAGTKLDPEFKFPASFKEQSAAYNTFVTVSVTLKNVPSGAKVYIDGKEAAVNGNTYSAEIGQASSTKNVKIEVRQGTKVLDSSTLTVKVDTGFFAKLISFFSNFLFNLFSWKKVTVNF